MKVVIASEVVEEVTSHYILRCVLLNLFSTLLNRADNIYDVSPEQYCDLAPNLRIISNTAHKTLFSDCKSLVVPSSSKCATDLFKDPDLAHVIYYGVVIWKDHLKASAFALSTAVVGSKVSQ